MGMRCNDCLKEAKVVVKCKHYQLCYKCFAFFHIVDGVSLFNEDQIFEGLKKISPIGSAYKDRLKKGGTYV